MPMALDLSPLHNAVSRLQEVLVRYLSDTTDAVIRDALIQRFEFTYDLAPKMLRRVLGARSDTPEDVDRMSFPALMRTAFEQGMVDEHWTDWLDYREMRNITSHTYDEDKAKEVAEAIPGFLREVRRLAAAIERYGAE
jgi:nucleotidyltransferase substrate binding protein (TIGR01987 family)